MSGRAHKPSPPIPGKLFGQPQAPASVFERVRIPLPPSPPDRPRACCARAARPITNI